MIQRNGGTTMAYKGWNTEELNESRCGSKILTLLLITSIGLAACGGGGGKTPGTSLLPTPNTPTPSVPSPSVPSAPAAPALSVSAGAQQLKFTWPAVAGATGYQLLKGTAATDSSELVPVQSTLAGSATETFLDVVVHAFDWANTRFVLRACNHGLCTDSNRAPVENLATRAVTYVKASNPSTNDKFGRSVAISDDGNVIAIGAEAEDSAATGINGNQNDESASNAGAVYVYVKSGGVWSQQAYLKGSNTNEGDNFGNDVALNADGSVLVVGAPGESSRGQGVNGNQDQSNPTLQQVGSGAAYVFSRSGSTWTQSMYLKASNPGSVAAFGHSVALDSSGTTLVVGSWGERSASRAINGDQSDTSAAGAGAAYVFISNAGSWSQQAYLKASNADAGDNFGMKVKLSGKGDTLVVSAVKEASAARGVNGDQSDNTLASAGAVYLFTRSSAVWSQRAYIKPSNPDSLDFFGLSLALSDDGDVLAVGAPSESSNTDGVDGNQADNSKPATGAVYVFTGSGSNWTQQAYLKASNTTVMPQPTPSVLPMVFGDVISLSANGTKLAVGAWGESGAAVGINGNQTDSTATAAGAVYFFERPALQSWVQRSYIKAPNTQSGDYFGYGVALSADGNVLVVTARQEDSRASGIDGNQNDDEVDTANIGAAYVY